MNEEDYNKHFNEIFKYFENIFGENNLFYTYTYNTNGENVVFNKSHMNKEDSTKNPSEKIKKLELQLEKELSKENFEKCIEIKSEIDRLNKILLNKDSRIEEIEENLTDLSNNLKELSLEHKFEECIIVRDKIKSLKKELEELKSIS